jgi:hypothetical protein
MPPSEPMGHETECVSCVTGRHPRHRWIQEKAGKWPYDGQKCLCGRVTFEKGVGAKEAKLGA